MLSVVKDGKVLDFSYRRPDWNHNDSGSSVMYLGENANASYWLFYIGDEWVGRIYKEVRGTRVHWTAVPEKGRPTIQGFKTRYYASEYILKVLGYWN